MCQETKNNIIKSLFMKHIDACYDRVIPKRVGNFRIGDSIESNNGVIGTIKAFVIVFNRIFVQIELFINGVFFMHHYVDSKDLN